MALEIVIRPSVREIYCIYGGKFAFGKNRLKIHYIYMMKY